MKFYNRIKELEVLARIKRQSEQESKMTIVTGRRRIGKTRLITHSLAGEKYLYFFVARKSEQLLCEEFMTQIKTTLDIPVFGELRQFKEIFNLLMNYAKQQAITLVIDEFQEFMRINPSVYSDVQNTWDRHKQSSKMNLILSGSVYSLMKKIFENAKEPLFGRTNEQLFIRPFSAAVQQEILTDFYPNYTAVDLLNFYTITGGIPKYIEHFIDKECFTSAAILDEILRDNSLFLEEGKHVLIEEFGKEYTTYFSILSLLASSKTSRREIESVLQKDIGGHLSRLEQDYQIIERRIPILAKPGSKTVKYRIRDNFLNFWFRFIYKNRGAVEIRNFPYIRELIARDFSTFSGAFLEQFIREQLAATQHYSIIGSYWERGNQNEIDIVALNEMNKTALIGEVKLQKKNISIPKLESKAYNLVRKLGGYTIEYRGFSLEEI